MNLHQEQSKINFSQDTVVTIGNFDGVHRGHEALLAETVRLADRYGLRPVVFTFQNHPLEYLYEKKIEYLNLPERKLELFDRIGIQDTVRLPFDGNIMNLSTEDFSQKILVDTLRAKHVVMGFDSRLGKGRQGKVEYLKETGDKMGFIVHIVPPVLVDNMRVSSSFIRELIKDGKMEAAAHFLGRFYELEGTIIHGTKLGRKLGYPTANFRIDYPLVLPLKGVYYCQTMIDDCCYDAAVSVGDNPTIENKGFTVEGHILRFQGDLYGKVLRLQFVKRLRNEMKFEDLDGLKNQLLLDVTEIRNSSLLSNDHVVE